MFIRFLGYFQLPIFGALDQLWKFDAKKQAIRIELFSKHSTKNLWTSLKVLHCCFCWDLVKQNRQKTSQLPTSTTKNHTHPSINGWKPRRRWWKKSPRPHGVRNRHLPVARHGWNRGVGVVVGISGLDPVERGVEKLEVERGSSYHSWGRDPYGRLVYLHMIFTKTTFGWLKCTGKMFGKNYPLVSWSILLWAMQLRRLRMTSIRWKWVKV